MYLHQVRVQNYRSVHDSGTIDIEQEKTLFVGVNEAGKTALLKAIQQTNPPSDTESFTALRDYPRSRYTEVQRGQKTPENIRVVEATFLLEEEDKEALKEVSPGLPNISEFIVTRYLDNSQRWSFGNAREPVTYSEIENDLLRLRAHLQKQEDTEDLLTNLAAILDKAVGTQELRGVFAEELTEWLKTALPLVDEGNDKEVSRLDRLRAKANQHAEWQAAAAKLLKRIPLFVYYSTYFTVRPRIHLKSLAQREAAGDLDEEYDFGNLCLLKLLGFTAKELSDLAAGEPRLEDHRNAHDKYAAAVDAHQKKLDDRQYRLNAASVDLTNAIREVWGDDKVQLRLVADGQYLKVVVVDSLGVEVELDQRSEGFRWLVSFFVVFKAQAKDDLKNAILLLDEPGLSLHALKQQEFRNTVSQLAVDNQVIYTTHSPFMVGTDELDLVRIIEMKDRHSGTKVHTRFVVDDPRSVYPLQAALGYELAQSLFGQKRNLVCEGLTDMMYVEALNTALSSEGKGFKKPVALVPASSASKVVYYTTLLVSQDLKVAALLDSDQAGERAANQDELVRLLNKRQILRTKDFISEKIAGPEIEDLLRDTLVNIAKEDLGWDITTTAATQPSRRVVDIFGTEIADFSKYKLVRAFINWLGTHEISELNSNEQEAVTKLFSAVNRALP